MDETELQHWMRLACCRTLAVAQQAAQGLVQAHGSKPGGQQVPIQVPVLNRTNSALSTDASPGSAMLGLRRLAFGVLHVLCELWSRPISLMCV